MITSKNNSVRVASYSRVSTQEQAIEGTSLDFQQAQLTGYCQLQGWTVINSYVDPGFSGKDGDRPGLKRLLADAKLGLFDKVVVFKLDRLARNLSLLLDMEKVLKSYGITLISMKESVDTSTATGKMVFQMFGMVSRMGQIEHRRAYTEWKTSKVQGWVLGWWQSPLWILLR